MKIFRKTTIKPRLQGLRVVTVSICLFFLFGASHNARAEVRPFNLKVRADQLLKQGHIEQAISFYKEVLQADDRFANAYYNLATAYFLQGEFQNAAENLELFLRLHPEDAEALYNLGCLRLKAGSIKKAHECFLQAEQCSCAKLISTKIKEALRFMKDLQSQNPDTQKLFTYLLTDSPAAVF